MRQLSSVNTLTLDEGCNNIRALVSDLASKTETLNEADTRFQFIDRIIIEGLGWPRHLVSLERPYGGTYTDYEIGKPCQVIWEAKKEGVYFELPAQAADKIIHNIDAILKISPDAKSAILQAQRYCSDRGVECAVVSNSYQIIVFLATRHDGTPPLLGKCLVFDGHASLAQHFPALWQALSPAGIEQGHLRRLLRSGGVQGIPPKLSTRLTQYPRFRYPSESQQSLRVLSELLIEDAPNTPSVERHFYEECYCESGALAKEALVSRDILAARYAALFHPSESAPTVQPIKASSKYEPSFSNEVIAEALGRRPIVLIGDVGVGKTSFLKHLMYVRASQEFKNAIFMYIDLGAKASLSRDLPSFFVDEIERQLLQTYEVDIYESSFVKGVHHGEIVRFENGVYKNLKAIDPRAYEIKLIEKLDKLTSDKSEHLKASIKHISNARRQQVIVAIDNADQRSLEVQQDAFIISQEIAKNWDALVFVAVRPATFHHSKRSGALSAYPQRVLTISPPRPDVVLEKRLVFALDMAEGRLPLEKLSGVSIRLDSIALFLRALQHSLRENMEIVELLSNITGGNIRQVIEFVTKFIGSPNVDSDKIIDIMARQQSYLIPLHEFSKAALLGDYAHFHDPSSIALNLFDVRYPERREHFLASLLIAFLNWDGPHRNREGFVVTEKLVSEMQSHGFIQDQIEAALRRLTNKKLVETTERVTFDEGLEGLIGEMPSAFRATTIGIYHILKWAPTFAYLDAMVFDTPIFDKNTVDAISSEPNSFEISTRYERATDFRSYLTDTWNTNAFECPYYDWNSTVPIGKPTFESVARVIGKGSVTR